TAFLLAFDRGYARMATALVRSLEHYHADPDVRVLTLAKDVDELRAWARQFQSVRVDPFADAHSFRFGEWHPLIWAKLAAFACADVDSCVVLDVDQIMYCGVDEFVDTARASGKSIAASPDMTRLHGHMRGSWRDDPELRRLPDAPCFNAGAMIIRPDVAIYRDVLRVARAYNQRMFLPEQGVLNLWAYLNEGHCDLTDRFMLPPMSPKLLRPAIDSCLVHFWTPRPPFFGANPARSGEPTWEEFTAAFRRDTGAAYPTERFRADFEARLQGSFTA
ncbi:MAG: hypothetical protein KC486_00040, partial [Myxococcales bacterium]|nr:hypothetical protein [Myxococcales bacterium]